MATFALRIKPTRAEHDARIEVAAHLLGSMAHNHMIINELKKAYQVNKHTAQRYMARARILIRQRTGQGRFEHRMEAEAFYRTELQRSNEPMVRIKCRERLDSIHGVDAKFENGPAQPESTKDVATESAAALTVDAIDSRIEAGAEIDPASLAHLPRADRLRILRKLASR